MIGIDGLHAFLAALDRIELPRAQQTALEAAAERIAETVRASLAHRPGDDHATPWLRTGRLLGSIGVAAEDTEAVIGSTDPVAVHQEFGTRTVPPRPFLATAGASGAEEAAREVGAAMADAIRSALR